MKRIAFCLAVLASSGANAGQPISESMIDCAALFDKTNRMSSMRQSTARGEALAHAADQFLDAAQREAIAEGRSDAAEYVADLACRKADEWDGKGLAFVFSQEFRDWAGYCRSLASDRGIDLDPSWN